MDLMYSRQDLFNTYKTKVHNKQESIKLAYTILHLNYHMKPVQMC